ncbi:MAG TPA: hypothetical protein VFR02_00810, partial [bacterium]|nr:hypothetical protein [bacterium]
MKGVGGFFIKIAAGSLLAWVGVGAACLLGQSLAHLTWGSPLAVAFAAGFVLYFPVHFLLYRPVLSHVLAHELTHALAAMAL